MNADMIADGLKALRIEKRLTLEEVSKSTGYDKSVLSRYETKSRKIPLKALIELLEFYGKPINIFFKELCAKMHIK